MLTDFRRLDVREPLRRAVEYLMTGGQQDFPVMDGEEVWLRTAAAAHAAGLAGSGGRSTAPCARPPLPASAATVGAPPNVPLR
jgi:hypothetical protein